MRRASCLGVMVLGGIMAMGVQVAGADDAAPATTPAATPTLESLQSEISEVRDQNLKLRSDLGLDTKGAGTLVKAAGKESGLRVGGLIQVQADSGDKGDYRFSSDNDRFYLRRARVNVAGEFTEGFEFKIEEELAGSLSDATAMRAQMTDGYLAWKKYSAATIRVGQFKTPFGFEQLSSDPKMYTIERSLGNDRLTLGRQVGAQLGGESTEKMFTYAAGVFNGSGVNSSSNDNSKLTWVGRGAVIPWQGTVGAQASKLSFGADGFVSDDSLGGQPSEFGFNSSTGKVNNLFLGEKTGYGVDAQYNLGRFDLWTEYLQVKYEPDNKVPSSSLTADAWYVQASFFVVPTKVQGVVKYDTYDPDKDSTDTLTVGLNYYVKGDDLKLQLDYLSSDVPDVGTENKVIARAQVMF